MMSHVPNWSPSELDVMRVGLGYVVVRTFTRAGFMRPSGKPTFPMGVARVIDLSWLGSPRATKYMQLGAYLAALLYVARLLVPFALVYLSVAVVLDITYRSSFGSVNHGDHLLAIVLTAQAIAVIWWNTAVHWGWHVGTLFASSQDTTAAWFTVQAILACYVLSGTIKLVNTRGRWIQRSPGILLDARSRVDTQSAWGRARKGWSAPDREQRLNAFLLERPTLTRIAFAGGLCIEIGSVLGLLGKVALLLVGIALIILHKANSRMLGLPFVDYQLLVLVFLVNVPWVH